ncbi:MAG: hypothetical protein V7609_1728 [Verrucomicrobiota bacterium]
MTEANNPPPNPPPPPLTPSGSILPPASPVAKKKSAKPWLWGGCGCLTLLLILAVVGLLCGYRYLGLSNALKRSSGNYDPYKGALTALLPEDLSRGGMKILLVTKKDSMDTYWKDAGATEVMGFTYNQNKKEWDVEAIGVLANFPSWEQAQAALKRYASEKKATPTSKEKGLRVSLMNDQIIGWTNGSLLCVVGSGWFPGPAKIFEGAAPF